MTDLDEELHARLRVWADEGAPELGDEARARVLDRVVELGPGLVDAARAEGPYELDTDRDVDALRRLAERGASRLDEGARRRVLDRVVRQMGRRDPARRRLSYVLIPLAAAAALGLWTRRERDSFDSTERVPPPVCATWPAARGPYAVDGLGRRGSLQVEGELETVADDGCTTELILARGVVRVEAADLGGGTLRVRAGDVLVEVRGTRFHVVHASGHVEVGVAEGLVTVRTAEGRVFPLRAGERWARGRGPDALEPTETSGPGLDEELDGPARDPVEAAERGASGSLRAARTRPEALDAHEHPPDTARPATEELERALLARAETLWRAGDHDAARSLFERLGESGGPLAEAAWIRLARLELRADRLAAARRAVHAHQRLFPTSRFGAEALWLEADVARRSGDRATHRDALARLRARYPDSPQADAASRLALPEEP